MAIIRNLTPHAVTLVDESGAVVREFPAETPCPRVAVVETAAGEIDGVPVIRQTFGEVVGLPEPQEGVWLIVSQLVQNAAKDRTDLLVPSRLVRNADGRIIGCRALAAN